MSVSDYFSSKQWEDVEAFWKMISKYIPQITLVIGVKKDE
jgi:hypothetical protein